ncbi:MAG TPA: 2-oxo-4-hydroxy-4-carboxy-5-ureidoimidazoline decarboxylase [Ignavibacteria bacterium]|nr:2-oxo-4-hydroxy-4-carboxy-5-ureidoimidazoline decarboxylase [Ignavibacteria bacterium]
MNLDKINNATPEEAFEIFSKCCGSVNWVNKLLSCRPFDSEKEILDNAGKIWYALTESDWREAFEHHPKIGDLNSLKEKYSGTKSLAENEQAGMDKATGSVLSELTELNREYENKFGYIFIVCATGKSANEILTLLKERIQNSPGEEIRIAMEEQNKITKIRIEKII